MIHSNYQEGQTLDVAGLNVVTVLLDRSQTQLTEVGWSRWSQGLEGPPDSHGAKEQIFFVIGETAGIHRGGSPGIRHGPTQSSKK